MDYNLILGENKVFNSNALIINIKWKNSLEENGIILGVINELNKTIDENDCIFNGQSKQNRFSILSSSLHELVIKIDLNNYSIQERISLFAGFETEKISKLGEIDIKIESGSDIFKIKVNNNVDAHSLKIFEIYFYKNIWKVKFIGMVEIKNIFEIFSAYGVNLKKIGFNEQIKTKIKFDKSKKIILEKGNKLSLAKQTKDLGSININLNWNMKKNEKKGFFEMIKNQNNLDVDLDLGCFIEFKNGEKRVIQALGNAFGNFDNFPYVMLDKDDRTGQAMDGENLFINGSKLKEIRKILIYTFIYEGAAEWKGLNGVVTIRRKEEQDIIINLDETPGGKYEYMCALLTLENKNDETFAVEKLIRYFNGHEQLDRAYGWNFRWTVGSKD